MWQQLVGSQLDGKFRLVRLLGVGGFGAVFLAEEHVAGNRDMKPGNIIRVDNRWKLSDLGLVRQLGGEKTVCEAPLGTLCYMSPESLGGGHSSACERWSLEVTLAEARGRAAEGPACPPVFSTPCPRPSFPRPTTAISQTKCSLSFGSRPGNAPHLSMPPEIP